MNSNNTNLNAKDYFKINKSYNNNYNEPSISGVKIKLEDLTERAISINALESG
jgi:hypothetical protein